MPIFEQSKYVYRVKTIMWSQRGAMEDFSITIKLYQGSTLSSYLFNLVFDITYQTYPRGSTAMHAVCK